MKAISYLNPRLTPRNGMHSVRNVPEVDMNVSSVSILRYSTGTHQTIKEFSRFTGFLKRISIQYAMFDLNS